MFVVPSKTAHLLQHVVVWINCELRDSGVTTLICGLLDRILIVSPNARVYLVGRMPEVDDHEVRLLTPNVTKSLWNQFIIFFPVPLTAHHTSETPTQLFILQSLSPSGLLVPSRLPPEYQLSRVLYIPMPIYSIHPHKGPRLALGSDSLARAKADMFGRISNRVASTRNEYHIVIEPLVRDRVCASFEFCLHVRAALVIDPFKSVDDAIRDLERFVKMREKINAPYGMVLWFLENGALYDERNRSFSGSVRSYVLQELRPLIRRGLVGRTESGVVVHCFDEFGRVPPTNFDCYYGQALGHAAVVSLSHCPKDVDTMVLELHCPGLDLSDTDWKLSAYVPRFTLAPESHTLPGSRVPNKTSSSMVRHRMAAVSGFLEENVEDLNVWYLRELFRNAGPLQYSGHWISPPMCLKFGALHDPNFTVPPPAIIPDLPDDLTRASSPYSPVNLSPLECSRLRTRIDLPAALRAEILEARVSGLAASLWPGKDTYLKNNFPLQASETSYPHLLRLTPVCQHESGPSTQHQTRPLKIGLLIASGITTAINNIACGLRKRCKRHSSTLLAFRSVSELIAREANIFHKYFDDLYLNRASVGWRTTPLRYKPDPSLLDPNVAADCAQACADLVLDGLVVCGGRLAVSGCALLTEVCLQRQIKTCILCLPCNHDNDIDSPLVETCVGWDTTMASICADLARQSYSDGTWLISTIGFTNHPSLWTRASGPSTVEAGLRCHADFIVIPEIYEEQDTRDLTRRGFATKIDALVADLVAVLCDCPESRDALVCVPADAIDRISHVKIHQLLHDIDALPKAARREYQQWPKEVQDLVETYDGLESDLVAYILVAWVISSGRSQDKRIRVLEHSVYPEYSLPSKFDCELAFAYGVLSHMLTECRLSGYLLSFRNLIRGVDFWFPTAIPLMAMLDAPGFVSDPLSKSILPPPIFASDSHSKNVSPIMQFVSDPLSRNTSPIMRFPRLDLRGPLLFAYLRHRSLVSTW
eukprot:Gregarina_sp_Poly_1__6816@NODE_368_length_9159_cov_50_005939_g304_i0_p2_GENE_NODE_368_length_9159_cov_50_005939_g304_i0NODE_368_length_9159_cov_50_005939_g304_i0_p2_ORF_typecomplete_len1148_score133_02PFK/PF00365_20/0_42PFK/PF00365_20/4_7e19_NODE_368_length_9159_cov_50_005939_g304_i057168679